MVKPAKVEPEMVKPAKVELEMVKLATVDTESAPVEAEPLYEEYLGILSIKHIVDDSITDWEDIHYSFMSEDEWIDSF